MGILGLPFDRQEINATDIMDGENFYVGYAIGIVKGLCDYPDEVRVEKTQDERGVLLLVDVNKVDMGKVIGMKGETIQAIRKLVAAVGGKEQARVALKLNEPDGRDR